MNMGQWWNDTDRGNWSTGRKTLYSVGGRWMNEWVQSIGSMILTGKTEVLGEKHYTALVVDEWMSMENWWNDTDRGKWSTGEKHYRASVVDEWIWGIGRMILTGEIEVLGEEHYTAPVVDEWMSMEHWWNDTNRGNWSTGHEPKPPHWKAGDWLPQPCHNQVTLYVN